LVAGCDADLVLLDEGMKVQRTFVGGECVYA
jgi:N-acetylglucosamine-6-phosphate deacetylase